MRQRLLPLLVILLAASPLVQGHGGETHEPGTVEPVEQTDPEVRPPAGGYTGPGPEPYLSFFEGTWLYGQATAVPLGHQMPRNFRGFGDWLVWEDANTAEIYAYNIPAGSGYYLTSDSFLQRNPEIHGNVVVWEDYRNGGADIYAYFLETGESRRLSIGPGNHRNPSIHGTLVAWEDDRSGTRDIWAAYLDGSPEFPVKQSEDRESDPLVVDGVVYYRTYRFNVWDIHARDVSRNETYELTADTGIESAPFTNGRKVLFLTQYYSAWSLATYDPARERVEDTEMKFQDAAWMPAYGEHVIMMARDLKGAMQLIARNVTSGESNHISGNLWPTSEPHLWERTVHVPVMSRNGTSLLTLEVSEFAFAKKPTLTITSPGSIAPWLRPINVAGILTTGPGWTDPTTFTVTIDGGAPKVIAPAERWRVTLDPEGYDYGNHRVVIRATFREGPPVSASLTLVIPSPGATVDVAEAGPAYHAARALATFNQYVGDNPAAWVILPLLLVVIVLVVIRLVYYMRAKRRPVPAQYVSPDEA